MSNLLNSTNIALLEKKLDAVWLRQQVISDNIANASTPGYKSKSVEFESLLGRELSMNGAGEDEVRDALNSVNPQIVRQEGTSAREDGNNVDEVFESIEMARTLIEYNYLCNSLSSEIKRMKYVITEGRG
jgi:flagellar basal-body rod protein FlgB